MKKIVFICPYFGKLPLEQTNLWLKTCSYNKKIDFIIITDDCHKYDLPQNVKLINTTLKELKINFEKKLNMNISLENGYKLCDFKPLYGFLFSELISSYEYWGHCDLSDCIFGDIQKYLFEIIKKAPDKIGFFGHMTLYKNTKEVNERFYLQTKSNVKLSDIICSPNNMAFDEINPYSINTIYKENNFKIERFDDVYFDITTDFKPFRHSIRDEDYKFIKFSKKKYIFEWNRGKLYKIHLENKSIIKEELGYIHYQKRKMKYNININNDDYFFVVPNEFLEIENLNFDLVKKYTKSEIINFTYFRFKFKRLIFKIKKKLKIK